MSGLKRKIALEFTWVCSFGGENAVTQYPVDGAFLSRDTPYNCTAGGVGGGRPSPDHQAYIVGLLWHSGQVVQSQSKGLLTIHAACKGWGPTLGYGPALHPHWEQRSVASCQKTPFRAVSTAGPTGTARSSAYYQGPQAVHSAALSQRLLQERDTQLEPARLRPIDLLISPCLLSLSPRKRQTLSQTC